MDLVKKGFQLPQKITFEEETLTDFYGKLVAEPLERGYGTTIGNSLRRVLLSSIEGAAVTGIRMPGVLHEFSAIKSVKEDVVDIVLNVKKLRFRVYSEGTTIVSIKVNPQATNPRARRNTLKIVICEPAILVTGTKQTQPMVITVKPNRIPPR